MRMGICSQMSLRGKFWLLADTPRVSRARTRPVRGMGSTDRYTLLTQGRKHCESFATTLQDVHCDFLTNSIGFSAVANNGRSLR